MATSRLEKIGNIFTRVQGLLKSGAMKYEDRPLFYEIYQSFPPLNERKFKEPVDPSITIRPIFYAEDIDRAARDESNTLYNLNEGSRSRMPEPAYTNSPNYAASSTSAHRSETKLYDLKDLTDLKQ